MSLELRRPKRQDEAPNTVDHAVANGLADRSGIRHHAGVRGNAHDAHPSVFWVRYWPSADTSAGFVTSCRMRNMNPCRCGGAGACRHKPASGRPGQLDHARSAPGTASSRDLSDLGRCERWFGGQRCHGCSGNGVWTDRPAQRLVPDQPSGGWIFSGEATTAQIAAFQPALLIVATIIHLVTSLLVGLLYGADASHVSAPPDSVGRRDRARLVVGSDP